MHPNTVDIRMKNEAGKVMEVRGESLGGGKVHISASTAFRLISPGNTAR